MEPFQCEQVIIAGDDRVSSGLYRTFQDPIGIGVGFDGSDASGGIEDLTEATQLLDDGDGLFRGEAELGPLQNVPQLIENGE